MTPIVVFAAIACGILGALIGRRGHHRIRGAFLGLLLGGAAAAVVTGILSAVPSGPSGHDYRDTAQLAEAIKNAEHSATASCGKLAAGKYICVAAFTDGTSGSYGVTVAPDGSSYAIS